MDNPAFRSIPNGHPALPSVTSVIAKDKDLIVRDEGGGVGRGFALEDLVIKVKGDDIQSVAQVPKGPPVYRRAHDDPSFRIT